MRPSGRSDATAMAGKTIAIVLPTLGAGGTERVALRLMRSFRAAGHRVEFVLMEKKGELLSEVPDDVRIIEAEPLDEWAAWQDAGWDRNSVVADPLFVDWQKDDWRLKPESPAWKLGWQEIPVGKIGVRPKSGGKEAR